MRMDVIVVHHHAAASVRDAVAALRDDASATGVDLYVIVADNGSTPEERALLRSLRVEYVACGRNAGYAGAAKIAFPRTQSDAIVLMNEDVFVRRGCLRALHAALMDGAAVAGPAFYWDLDATFLLPCTEERTRGAELLKIAAQRSLANLRRARDVWRAHVRRFWSANEPVATTSLSGALLAFRRDTWTTIGPLDDEYLLYFEENDWLNRVAEAGLTSMYVPSATAIHLHNPTIAQTPERLAMQAHSFMRFGARWYGATFMRRLSLLSRRESVVPEWTDAGAAIPLDFDGCKWPLWVEVSPSPLGFPAAAMRIDTPRGALDLPRLRGLSLDVPLHLQVVDDSGREWSRYAFRINAPLSVR